MVGRLRHFLLYWNGFEEGPSVPAGINDLPFCVPIASQLPHAVGIGMAIKIKNEKKVVLAFLVMAPLQKAIVMKQ